MTLTSGLSPAEALELKVKDAYRRKLEQAVQPGGFYPTTATQYPYIAPSLEETQSINLNEGAWDIPISQLVDLWVVRYGNKWVDESELDEFYEVAARRLRTLNKIESHYVNGKDVFRIVE